MQSNPRNPRAHSSTTSRQNGQQRRQQMPVLSLAHSRRNPSRKDDFHLANIQRRFQPVRPSLSLSPKTAVLLIALLASVHIQGIQGTRIQQGIQERGIQHPAPTLVQHQEALPNGWEPIDPSHPHFQSFRCGGNSYFTTTEPIRPKILQCRRPEIDDAYPTDIPAPRVNITQTQQAPAPRVNTPQDAPAPRVNIAQTQDVPAPRVNTPQTQDAPAPRVNTPQAQDANPASVNTTCQDCSHPRRGDRCQYEGAVGTIRFDVDDVGEFIHINFDDGQRRSVYSTYSNERTIDSEGTALWKFVSPGPIWTDLKLGDRVARGPNWIYDNQDGGDGASGIVTNVHDDGWVSVKWTATDREYPYPHVGKEEARKYPHSARKKQGRLTKLNELSDHDTVQIPGGVLFG